MAQAAVSADLPMCGMGSGGAKEPLSYSLAMTDWDLLIKIWILCAVLGVMVGGLSVFLKIRKDREHRRK